MDELKDFTSAELTRLRALDCARFIACLADRGPGGPVEKFCKRFPGSPNLQIVSRWKASIGAAPSTWGSSLITPPTLARALLDVSRPLDLLARLVQAGAHSVPLNVAINTVTTAATGFSWAGYGLPKPVSRASLETATLYPAVAAGTIAVANELLEYGIGSDQALVDLLKPGVTQFVNDQLVSADNPGNVDPFVPRSLVNHGSPAAASSTGDLSADLGALRAAYIADGGDMAAAVILISSANASAIAQLQMEAGGTPTVDTRGGVLIGCPCLASESLGDHLLMIDVNRLLIADPGEIDLDAGRHVSMEMSDAPTQDAGAATGASMVSLWQANCTAVRVHRVVSWHYSGAIGLIDSCDYGTEGSPL
jgi:hypothetical protein